TGKCFFCGDDPSSVMDHLGTNGAFTYNGLDRLDGVKGYVKHNVVSCCSTCNWMKGSMTALEFKQVIIKIHRHVIASGCEHLWNRLSSDTSCDLRATSRLSE